MTIDEVIQYMKRKYDRIEILNGKTGEYHSPYDKEIIEWLEELKAMRNLDKTNYSDGYNQGRQDAIEEFETKLIQHSIYTETEDGWVGMTVDTKRIEEIVEQLKENNE